jgi:hypothetical protein
MPFKKFQPLAFSILLHAGIIILLVSIALPHQQQEPEPESIKTYLLFDLPPLENNTVDNVQEVTQNVIEEKPVAVAKELEKSPLEIEQKVVPNEATTDTTSEIQPMDDLVNETQTAITTKQTNTSSPNVLTHSSTFIEALNAVELERLSGDAIDEYRQPKALIDKTKTQSNHRALKAQSSDFAPPGSDIMVIGKFGLNETTIMVGDSCLTVTETELHDPITRGASVWRKGNPACAKYDKFDGQLQKSLDKFLIK